MGKLIPMIAKRYGGETYVCPCEDCSARRVLSLMDDMIRLHPQQSADQIVANIIAQLKANPEAPCTNS